MVSFLHFVYSEQSGTRSKMWNLVVIFFYCCTNSGFSLSVYNCYLFLIHFTFFYTQGSLVEGFLEVLLFLYLHKSGTWVSLVSSMLVSKVSYYLNLSSLLYLCESGTRLLQDIALFPASLHFSTYMSLAYGNLSKHCIISGFTLLFYFHVQQHVVWLSLPLHSG